ncbi:MAG: methionine adenosyltransferase [Ignavibacteria bacterium]
MSYLWTSEYVSPGHPDKVADQISDTLLDVYLRVDPRAKVAAETMVKGNTVYLCGEITSAVGISQSDLEKDIRKTIAEIGYNREEYGFNAETCKIVFDISEQSREINQSVELGDERIGAGDQGFVFGYATKETPTFMPPAIYLAKQIINHTYGGIQTVFGGEDMIRPDMKSQVTLRYDEHGVQEIDTVLLSCCHSEKMNVQDLTDYVQRHVFNKVKEENPEHIQRWFTENTKYLINPAGTWNIGGPVTDCGLTGRKIVIDQYGADCPIGGGAFSGKDSSKVDRSAAYLCRFLALHTLNKNVESKRIMVQLAYAIGVEHPVSYRIVDQDTKREYGLGDFSLEDLTPRAIQERFGLLKPIYLETARKGHFGNKAYTNNGIEFYAWDYNDHFY